MKKISMVFIALCTNILASNADVWIPKSDFGGTSRGNAAGFVINGKGYVGSGSPVFSAGKTFWEYDPETDVWTQKTDFPGTGREGASAFSIAGKGYVGLGTDNDDKFLEDFWEFDPESNSWVQKANFPGGKRSGAFSFALANKGYVGGGAATGFKKDFWEYEPVTDTWTKKGDYSGGKVVAAAVFTIENKAYVGTGRDNTLEYRNDFWEYDPLLNVWLQKADFPGDSRAGSVAFSINQSGYLGLGYIIDSSFSDFWMYNPFMDLWAQVSDYAGAPGNAVGFSIENNGYVGTGGISGKQWWQYVPDCPAPTGLMTTNIKSASAKVSWAVEPSAQTYSVRYRKTGTLPWTKTTALLNYKKLTGLTAETIYDWSVKSVCDVFNHVSSDWSATQNFTTKPLKLEEEREEGAPIEVYPNPFSSSATISFYLSEAAHTSIDLFDLAGRKTKTLFEEYAEAGNHRILLTAEPLRAGIYLLQFHSGSRVSAMKMVIE